MCSCKFPPYFIHPWALIYPKLDTMVQTSLWEKWNEVQYHSLQSIASAMLRPWILLQWPSRMKFMFNNRSYYGLSLMAQSPLTPSSTMCQHHPSYTSRCSSSMMIDMRAYNACFTGFAKTSTCLTFIMWSMCLFAIAPCYINTIPNTFAYMGILMSLHISMVV